MDKVALSFSTNAKLEKLIGRELITNNIIAIFELIKNSYDAFAHNAIVSFEGFDISSKDLGKVRHSERVISNVDSRIIIKDDGEGIDKKDLPHIFKRFYKGKSNSKEDSVGIGLAMAKSIIESQNGDIYVKSEKNKGTEFHIVIHKTYSD